ncbi:flagellar hook-associated protein FlgL [Hydrocarboniclastica marina]|uniref:Flagellar hook-associated protein 3 n=1 Tax=Hydrocarboniclastica marina TaxID=2259620 RepID=A0A4P7XGU6_9ALTE|nr:flagellar hook-associated protein FlgL [Hydrocarboniclastica marina]MAL98373.1 flagellar hook-associated protein 3 [Alteromonadaceae bacterium]QCF25863.1 flagellar hook-associated protein 3 [Hydrocarboniclastica marina]|tara:strand:- start:193 stop:1077 length:885 start_codon:yes stop_codon:yes gene_type:complete
MRISSQQIFHTSVQRMQDISMQQAKTQEQLSTGNRVNRPSDDPVAASRMLQLDQELARTEQFQRNIDFAENRLQQEDSTLNSMNDLLVRVRELTVQVGNGSLSADDRSYISAELSQRLEQMAGLANSKDSNGQYVFGGYDGDNPPYVQVAGAWTYQGTTDQRSLEIDSGVKVPISDNGDRILGGEATFATLEKLISDIAAGDINVAVEDALTGIDDAQSRILEVRAQVGARLNTIESTRDFHTDSTVLTEGVLSEIRDLDYAEAISRFSQQNMVLQAAQQSFSRISQLSLFDRL